MVLIPGAPAERGRPQVLAPTHVDGDHRRIGRLPQRQPPRHRRLPGRVASVKKRGTPGDGLERSPGRRAAAHDTANRIGAVGDVAHVGPGPSVAEADHRVAVGGGNVQHAGFGIDGGARPVGAAARLRSEDRAAQRQRCVERAEPELPDGLERHLPDLGGEVRQVLDPGALHRERRRLGREGLGGRHDFAFEVGVGRRRALLDGPDRLAGHSIERVDEPLLGDLGYSLHPTSIDGDVEQIRRRRAVVVPDLVMNELVVPHPLAGAYVETDDAVGEQIVTQAMAAVVVRGHRRGRNVDVAELRVRAQIAPGVAVAGVAPRFVFPGVGAELVGALRHDVKLPQPLSGAHVVGEDEAGRPLLGDGEVRVVGSDDDRVADDERRRRPRADRQPEGLPAGRARQIGDEVDPPVVSELRNRYSGPGVDGDQVAGAGAPDDAGVAVAFPVGRPSMASAGRKRGVFVGARVVNPEHLAGAPVDRRRLLDVRGQVQHAVDRERGRRHRADPRTPQPQVGLLLCHSVEHHLRRRQRRAALVRHDEMGVRRLPTPGDLQIAEVVGVDLVQGRVLAGPGVAGVGAPVAVGRARLRRAGGGRESTNQNQAQREAKGSLHRRKHHVTLVHPNDVGTTSARWMLKSRAPPAFGKD